MNKSVDLERPFGQRPDGTMTISFFSAPASQVCRTLVDWGREVRQRFTEYFPISGKWHEFLGEYITPDTTIILAPTRGDWCAYIDNDRIGGMPFSALLVVPERMRARSASFVIADLRGCRREKRPYAAMFNYCDATRGEAVQRSVAVV